MSHSIPSPNPVFTVKTLLQGGKSLEESLAIVRRAANELNMHVRLPTADEVHAYLEHRDGALRGITLMCAMTSPVFVIEPPPPGMPSATVRIAEAILELQHAFN